MGADVTLLHCTPLLFVLSTLILVCMFCLSRYATKKVRKYTLKTGTSGTQKKNRADKGKRQPYDFPGSLEKVILRWLQGFIFMLAYGFARTLADLHDWKEYFHLTLIYALIYAVIFAVFMVALPKYVPTFLQLMAIPPFVDEDNLAVLFSVLLDDRTFAKEKARLTQSTLEIGND